MFVRMRSLINNEGALVTVGKRTLLSRVKIRIYFPNINSN